MAVSNSIHEQPLLKLGGLYNTLGRTSKLHHGCLLQSLCSHFKVQKRLSTSICSTINYTWTGEGKAIQAMDKRKIKYYNHTLKFYAMQQVRGYPVFGQIPNRSKCPSLISCQDPVAHLEAAHRIHPYPKASSLRDTSLLRAYVVRVRPHAL